jgi:hypothetical protein
VLYESRATGRPFLRQRLTHLILHHPSQLEMSPDGVAWAAIPTPRWAILRARIAATAAVCTMGNKTETSSNQVVLQWVLWPSWEWALDHCGCRTKSWVLVLAACVLGAFGRGRYAIWR